VYGRKCVTQSFGEAVEKMIQMAAGARVEKEWRGSNYGEERRGRVKGEERHEQDAIEGVADMNNNQLAL
jgi:hypothetical protein